MTQSDTRQFATGATRSASDNKVDFEGFLSPLALRRFGEYMHLCRTRNVPAGETLRASDNWQKGMPVPEYMKSLLRHVVEMWLLLDGYPVTDERGPIDLETAACAAFFNVQGILHETVKARLVTAPRAVPAPEMGVVA